MKGINETDFKIPLGARVREQITNFTGIVVCRTQWLHNCNVYGVKPEKLKDDGSPMDAHHFDEPQLTVIDAGIFEPKRDTGGPAKSVPQTNR